MKNHDVIYRLAQYLTEDNRFSTVFINEDSWLIFQNGQEVTINIQRSGGSGGTGMHQIPAWVLANYVDVSDALCMVLDEIGKPYMIIVEDRLLKGEQRFRVRITDESLVTHSDFQKIKTSKVFQ
jgi:hypothetical protein